MHRLLAEVPGADEAEAWCKEAMAQYRDWRRAPGPGGRRLVFHELKPLSEVPVDDIERFLDVHYRLQTYYPELDPYRVAEWVHAQTGGVFSDTVGRRVVGWRKRNPTYTILVGLRRDLAGC